jgi:hypothetical protein
MIDTFLSQGAQPMYNGNGPGSWGGHMMYSPFGGLFPILLLVLAVAVAVILLKGRFGRDAPPGMMPPSPRTASGNRPWTSSSGAMPPGK